MSQVPLLQKPARSTVARGPVVYFIEDESGQTKVGHTADLCQRLRTFQTGSADMLTAVAVDPGCKGLEKRWQHAFAAYHVRGEWYASAPLRSVVLRLRARFHAWSGDGRRVIPIPASVDSIISLTSQVQGTGRPSPHRRGGAPGVRAQEAQAVSRRSWVTGAPMLGWFVRAIVASDEGVDCLQTISHHANRETAERAAAAYDERVFAASAEELRRDLDEEG